MVEIMMGTGRNSQPNNLSAQSARQHKPRVSWVLSLSAMEMRHLQGPLPRSAIVVVPVMCGRPCLRGGSKISIGRSVPIRHVRLHRTNRHDDAIVD